MDPADRDRAAPAGPATAGTLDSRGNAPGGDGGTADQAVAPGRAGGPAETAGGGRTGAETGVETGEQAGAAGPAGRLRRAATGPLARQAAVLIGFLAVGVAMTWPRATYLIPGLAPASRDSASYVWGFWWVAHQVTHLANPWFTPNMAAPVGVQLGFHTLMPLPGLLLAPVTLAAGPAFSYNLMVLAVPGLLCYVMYRAARLWLRSAAGAIAAGALYGYSAMLAQQDWYHLNIAAGAIFLPMALEASVRLRRSPGVRQAVILGVVMGAAVLTDQESAVLAAIVTALTLAPWLVRHPAWQRARAAGLAVAVGAVVASPQIIAMVAELLSGNVSIQAHTLAVSYKQYGIGLPGMFTPTPRVADFGLNALAGPFLHGRDNEGMPMFGAVLTVLAAAGIVAAWRRRATWKLAAMWIGCAALALGTSLWIGKHQYLPLASVWHDVRVSSLMPYTWFVRIPGLSSFREADRLAILGMLPATLLAGAAVDWLRYHARPLIAVAAAAAVLELGYSGAATVARIPAAYPAVDAGIAADHSNSLVLDIPFGLRGGIPEWGVPFFPQALYMATEDGHPRSIAYISRVPTQTVGALAAHPFYRDLVDVVQHEVPQTCPWRVLGQPESLFGCVRPYGVVPQGTRGNRALLPRPMPGVAVALTPAELAAATLDARHMRIHWVVMWKRNISEDFFVRQYLLRTGFVFAYRVGNVLVYRHQA